MQISRLRVSAVKPVAQNQAQRWGSIDRPAASWLAAAMLAFAAAGCQTIQPVPQPHAAAMLPPEIQHVPRELDKATLPPYVIEPPDILLIDALRVIPKPPFRIRPLDLLQIQVEGTLIDQPISGFFLVEPSGTVSLGPAYGKVKVSGLSLEEANEAVERHLSRILSDPQVAVTLAESAGQQQIAGEHLVGPDGTVNLGTYGSVYVTGMTLAEAKAAIEEHLSQYLEEPLISVDMFSYNSKVYYVVTEGAGFGDVIGRFPVTGNETVLDAIAQVNGLSRLSSKNIWIARPAPGGMGCDQILPVKWDEIVKGANTATNYQVLPGDRIFIAEDRMIALNSVIDKMLNPFERMFGFTLLGTQTVQNINRGRFGFPIF
jgi:polysaccharide export outer membrane protein